MGENCPICGTKLGKLSKTKIKDNVVVCTNCMGTVPFKDQMKRGNKDFSLEEVKHYVEMKLAGKKSASDKKEKSIDNTGTELGRPKKKRWLFWVVAIIVILGVIGNLTDNESDSKESQAETESISVDTEEKNEEEQEKEKQEEKEKQQKKEEEEKKKKEEEERKKKEEEEEKKKEKAEEERKANRPINEKIEEENDEVDKATLEDGTLTLQAEGKTTFSENTLFMSVYDMFEAMNEGFQDENVKEVYIDLTTTMVDQKGNESVESVIKYNYSRESFEELDYDNFSYMAYSEEWRILLEADYYYIHPGIYKNLKDKYKDHVNVEGFK